MDTIIYIKKDGRIQIPVNIKLEDDPDNLIFSFLHDSIEHLEKAPPPEIFTFQSEFLFLKLWKKVRLQMSFYKK